MASGLTRRGFLQASIALSPVGLAACASTPRQDDSLMLRAEDPVARTLAYYPNTTDVPPNHPLATNHDVSQRCADCLHQRGPTGDGGLRCPTFPGRIVSENGWCSLWTKS